MPQERSLVCPLGKGEVHSSILCGSTIPSFEITVFSTRRDVGRISHRDTERHESTEHDGNRWGGLGNCSRDVQCAREITS
jgi:hypothetical protein